MARIRTDQPVLPSLLDRLIDEDPQKINEASKTFGALLGEIRENIRRDLENLLNTRLFRQQKITDYGELETSVVNYGLEDFSRVQLDSDEDRERFRRNVLSVINRYEPRFRQVEVEISPVEDDYTRTLYLKISAVLMVEPDAVPLIFDSRVQTVDRAVKLRELRHG
jgi:type VI secretion system protein ImpF